MPDNTPSVTDIISSTLLTLYMVLDDCRIAALSVGLPVTRDLQPPFFRCRELVWTMLAVARHIPRAFSWFRWAHHLGVGDALQLHGSSVKNGQAALALAQAPGPTVLWLTNVSGRAMNPHRSHPQPGLGLAYVGPGAWPDALRIVG